MSLSKLSIRALVLLICAALWSAATYAQFRAVIEGTVTDSAGAIVKGAKITVTSQETGASQEAVADDAGFYSVAHLGPGLYTVSASLTGFKVEVIKDVRIAAEETTGVNVVLQPGAMTEQVTVNGDALPALQTEDASMIGTITKQEVQELPQFRGDPFELLRLTPGVFGTGARDSGGNAVNLPNYSGVGGSNRSIFSDENAVQISANGQRVEANGYQLDGVSTNSQAWGGATVLTPNEESVKEVKIEVSPYSAENSHGAGAIVEVVSQNGTNNLHGSLVMRIHSPGLNAFQRWGGPNGATPQRDNLLLHNYLGSLGGPIWKNKLFAFFSFEHMKTGGSNSNQNWVETPQFISGLPSGSIAAKLFAPPGSGFKNAKMLTSTCAVLGLAVSTSTCQDSTGANGTAVVTGGVDIGGPGGTAPDGIPDLQLIQYDGMPDNLHATQYNGRVDFNATSKDTFAFSLFHTPVTKTFLPGGWVDGRQYDQYNTDAHHDTAALLWTRTIQSTMVNEARMNVTRWYFDELKSNPQMPWGLPFVNISIPNNVVQAGPFTNPGIFYQTTYAFRDTLSKVMSSHVLKFGGALDKEQNNDTSAWGAHPTYDFSSLWTFASDTPADQQTATYDPKTGKITEFRKYVRVYDIAFFGQDNWKFKPNLTLTMGLRWEYTSPLHDKYGALSNIVLGQGAGALTGAHMQVGGNLSKPDYNNFGPQLGFAWSPRSTFKHEWNNKMVWRGGVGVAYNRIPESLLLQARGNPPSFFPTSLNNAAQINGTYGVSSGGLHSFLGFPSSIAPVSFDSNGFPIIAPGGPVPSIVGPVQDLRTPYTWHYSLEAQYDLGNSWVASLGYQGSESRKLPRGLNYQLFFAPNARFNSITLFRSDVDSNYNAMLARITHQFAHGLQLNATYRWSKSMDFCSSDQNCEQTFPFDQKTEYGPSDFDVTHSFTAFALYELPLVRNRHDWLYTVAGGWKLSGILQLNSGFPWTGVVGTCTGNVFGNVCPSRPTAYLGGAHTNYSNGTFQSLDGNFPGESSASAATCTQANSASRVICTTKYFTVVDSPLGAGIVPPAPGVSRNSFRGPHYTGIDMSFGKRFTLPKMPIFGENAGFEIKANAFNVFNKLNLSPFGFNSGSTNLGSFQTCTATPPAMNNCPAGAAILPGASTGTFFAPNSSFGRATGATGGRVFELMGRFSF